MKLSKSHDSGGWQLACLSLIQDKCPVTGHDPEIWKREICVSLLLVLHCRTSWDGCYHFLPDSGEQLTVQPLHPIIHLKLQRLDSFHYCVFFLGQTQMLSSEWLHTVRESRPTPNADICHVWNKVVWKCYQWSYFFHCPLFCVTVSGWLLALIC